MVMFCYKNRFVGGSNGSRRLNPVTTSLQMILQGSGLLTGHRLLDHTCFCTRIPLLFHIFRVAKLMEEARRVEGAIVGAALIVSRAVVLVAHLISPFTPLTPLFY